jgi:hypothetical protein
MGSQRAGCCHEVSEVEPAIPAAAPDGGAEGAMQKSCDAKPVKYLGDLTIRRGLLGTISGRDCPGTSVTFLGACINGV